MSAKTKIVVLHSKELIYTGILITLGVLFLILLGVMFLPKHAKTATANAETEDTTDFSNATYYPGVYTTSVQLGDRAIDVEVVVDKDYISSIRLVHLDEAVTTLYPLVEPSFDQIANQIKETQSLDNIHLSEDSRYTSSLLLNAIQTSIQKATIPH